MFNLQGHRGARGLKPENTLPSFETALDAGVSSIETDLHLSRDDVPVIYHDPWINERLCAVVPGRVAPEPATRPAVRRLSVEELRAYRADRNPDRGRFPAQDAAVTPAARQFARRHQLDPYTPPTLDDLFRFVAAYAGDLGEETGKTEVQRARAACVGFDLELKRVPFRPETIGDGFDGQSAGVLERRVVDVVQAAGVEDRTVVRSFDHRAVHAIGQLPPALATAVLMAGTVPCDPASLTRQAAAQTYCPNVNFLDALQVRRLHAHGIRVLPWTVNDAEDWERLLAWEVDGITTDFPDRLAEFLRQRGVAF
jgi:glycerophosphoryl diester phosphodiesterase